MQFAKNIWNGSQIRLFGISLGYNVFLTSVAFFVLVSAFRKAKNFKIKSKELGICYNNQMNLHIFTEIPVT